jgi:vacuolar-type H+-ATPase subunit F/Vma7
MMRIWIIGDMMTASAFRLCGLACRVSSPDRAERDIDEIVRAGDAGILLVTRELAESARGTIDRCNRTMTTPVIVVIPGINDGRGFGESAMRYITEALGITV